MTLSGCARSPGKWSGKRRWWRLRPLARQVVGQAALVTAPAFVGLAAVAPYLLPIVAGPGWEQAAKIAICLSLGSALAVPAGLIFTTFSAIGRPDKSALSLAFGVVGMLGALVALSPLGPISVGLSRVVGDAIRAGFAIFTPSGQLGWTRGARAATLRTAWILSAAMGALVLASSGLLSGLRPVLTVAAMTAIGVASYLALLAIAAREALEGLRAHLPAHWSGRR